MMRIDDLLLVLIVVVMIVLILLWRAPRFPYEKAPALLSPAEHAFLRALERVVAHRYRIFVKVRIADLITLRPGLNRKHALMALNRIAQKHVDFVLVDGAFGVVAAVELDDASHARRDRRRRDGFVDEVFRVAGLPLLRVSARGRYADAAIAQLLAPLNLEAVPGRAPPARARSSSNR